MPRRVHHLRDYLDNLIHRSLYIGEIIMLTYLANKCGLMRRFNRAHPRPVYAGDDPAIDAKTVRLLPANRRGEAARLERSKRDG